MLVWLFMLASIIVIWFMIPDALGEKKKKLIFLSVSCFIIVMILGGRHYNAAANSDLYGYQKWYVRAINMPLDQLLSYDVMEKGYLILNKILAFFVPWRQFIYYFQAAFCTGVMFRYIYKNTENVFLGVIVYICIGPWQFFLTAFRQAMAICICFIAFELIKKQKTRTDLIALALVALASTMHTSAWLFLIVFVIRRFKVGREIIIFSGVVTLLALMFSDSLMAMGNDTLGRDYTSGLYSGNAMAGLVPILIYILTFALCYFVSRHDKSFTDEYSMEIKMLIFGMCLYTLRYNTTIFERMSIFFTPVISVLLPSAIVRQKDKKEKIVLSVACVGMCVILFVYRAGAHYGNYHFYWEYIGLR